MIQIEGLVVELEGRHVLGPLDLELQAGALLGLIGPPGAGKSLLLKVIAGLVPKTKGLVRVLGQEVFRLKAPELIALRRQIGMVFQNNALFDSRTLFDNVAFPLRRAGMVRDEDEIQARVLSRLAEVALAGSATIFPHALSGGMQKRAAIARATIAEPRIRLYDEPTAGLDPVTSARIVALIADMHARSEPGISVVISNEVDTMLRAVPRVVMLHRGLIVFDGPRERLEDPEAPELARGFVRGDVDLAI